MRIPKICYLNAHWRRNSPLMFSRWIIHCHLTSTSSKLVLAALTDPEEFAVETLSNLLFTDLVAINLKFPSYKKKTTKKLFQPSFFLKGGMLFSPSQHALALEIRAHEAVCTLPPKHKVVLHLWSMAYTDHVFHPANSMGTFVSLFDDKALLLCLLYTCNYKTPHVLRATYCSFSSGLF